MAETWTVRTLLSWAREWLEKRGVETPRLDAELLLAHALGCERIRLYTDADKPLGVDELGKFKPLIQRRGAREPVAYILGVKEFYGRPFQVGPGVFIPRPETELLVQLALAPLAKGEPARVLDLCAGSGAIGVSMAAERPRVEVDLVELSPDAASFARRNAEKHAPGRVRVFEGDLFAALPPGPGYDVVAANPPYVPSSHAQKLAPDIRDHEPDLALFAGDDGLSVLRKIAAGLEHRLRSGGLFVSEIDSTQGSQAAGLLEATGLLQVKVARDLAGLDRLVSGRMP